MAVINIKETETPRIAQRVLIKATQPSGRVLARRGARAKSASVRGGAVHEGLRRGTVHGGLRGGTCGGGVCVCVCGVMCVAQDVAQDVARPHILRVP